jgi:hypothetical protein
MTTTNKPISEPPAGLRTPFRVMLEPAEMAAGFALLGRPRRASALFDDLPPHGTGVFPRLAENGQLKADMAAIFAVLADPRGSLAVDTVADGFGTAARFLWTASESPYVVVAKTVEGLWDLALLPEKLHLLAAIDDLLGLSDHSPGAGAFAVALPGHALAALAALGDLIEEEALKLRLNRVAGPGAVAFRPVDPFELARMVDAGIAADDLRWGVGIAAMLNPETMQPPPGIDELQAGLGHLMAAELVTEDGYVTAAGLGLARIVSRPILAAAITGAASNGSQALMESLLLYRSGEGLLAGAWGGEGEERTLYLSEVAPAAAMKMIEAVIAAEPPSLSPAGPVCPACHTPQRLQARFCANCGQRLAQ